MDHDWNQQLGRSWSKDDRCGLAGVVRARSPPTARAGRRNEMSIGFATGSRYVETGRLVARMVEEGHSRCRWCVGACPRTGVVGWRLLA